MSLRSESWHLASLVENFLLVTRIDSGVEEETYRKEAVSFNLSEVVDGVTYPFLDKARGQGAEFRVEVPSDLPPVFGVRGHVTQTLHQILDNAFKFADPKTPRVTMAALRDGPWVKIVIADNGRGVSPEGKEVLFQKLTQLDREVHEQQGSGLGLYISKKLLDINHGEISLECEP